MAKPNIKDSTKAIKMNDWVEAARKIIIKDGVTGINIRRLAKILGVTTGAFYWHYSNMEQLYESIRQDWIIRNTEPFTKAINQAGKNGWKQYMAYVRVLLKEDEYIPEYDNAIRDWAHSNKRTAEILKKTETFRIEQLRKIFLALGFKDRSAIVRANVTYLSQTGYNALRVIEPRENRLKNIPYYAEVLTGRNDLKHLKTAKEIYDFVLSN